MNLEPIHKIPADELQELIDEARRRIEWGLIFESEFILKAFVVSIKKSLLYYFREYSELIQETIDSNEATYALTSWAWEKHPLHEGMKALQKVYGVIHYEKDSYIFDEMDKAIKGYYGIASRLFLERQKRATEPLVVGGKIREKFLHAPKEKRNKYILKHCRELKKRRPFSSAEHLLNGFPERERAVVVDGAKVYRVVDENGNLKACCEMPNGKIRSVGLRKFHENYFKENKKKKKP